MGRMIGRLLDRRVPQYVGLYVAGGWTVRASWTSGPLSGMFPQPYGELFAIPVDGSRPALRLTHDKWEDALAYWGGVASD